MEKINFFCWRICEWNFVGFFSTEQKRETFFLQKPKISIFEFNYLYLLIDKDFSKDIRILENIHTEIS